MKNMFFLNVFWHRFLNVFVCAGPSKRKGRNSKIPINPLCFSYIFKMREFEILIEIHTSKVRFSSRRRRPFRRRFFIIFSSILAPFPHTFLVFFQCFCDTFLNDVLVSIFYVFWLHFSSILGSFLVLF